MLADSLVELLAGSAERLGGDQIAGKIRKLSFWRSAPVD